MSGYRSLHRVSSGTNPIWHLTTSPVLGKSKPGAAPSWRIWTACGDGLVRGYLIQEKSLEMQKDVLDASACTCTCTHYLLGKQQSMPPEEDSGDKTPTTLGCTQVRLVRNYVGSDDSAGDLLIVAMEISGKVRIWSLQEDMDEGLLSNETFQTQKLQANQEFVLENATGTLVSICPPKVSGVGDVLIAVACLDGSIAIVSSGLVTPRSTKDASDAGYVIERWSMRGGEAIAMSCDWHPYEKHLAIGRQNGIVEILGGQDTKNHRLIQHESPVRAVSFTPDGHLLLSASDEGLLCVWDVSRRTSAPPVLVHHVVQAHTSWILSLTPLQDSRRFVTCGADRRLQVWHVGQMDQAVHTFTADDTVWTIHAKTANSLPQQLQPDPLRLVSGSEQGGLQIFSLEG